MTSTVLVWILKAVQLLASALMAFKLYRTGLHRQYPIFFVYFLFRIPNTIWPMVLDTASDDYQKLWICTDPIVLTFYILMVTELYRLVLDKYKGLYTLGRWAMYVSVMISVTISALSLMPRIKPTTPQQSRIMAYVFAADRGISTALAIFIILLLLFLSRYPVRLSRNVRTHALLYSIFFLCNTFVLLARAFFGMRGADEVNTALLAGTVACIVAWLILLTPQGAEAPGVAVSIGPQHEDRLLSQLDSFNAALLRMGRR